MTSVPRVRNRARPRTCRTWREGGSPSPSPRGRPQDCMRGESGENLGVGVVPFLPCRPLGWGLDLRVRGGSGQRGCIGGSIGIRRFLWASTGPPGLRSGTELPPHPGPASVPGFAKDWPMGWALGHAGWPGVCWSSVMTMEVCHVGQLSAGGIQLSSPSGCVAATGKLPGA